MEMGLIFEADSCLEDLQQDLYERFQISVGDALRYRTIAGAQCNPIRPDVPDMDDLQKRLPCSR